MRKERALLGDLPEAAEFRFLKLDPETEELQEELFGGGRVTRNKPWEDGVEISRNALPGAEPNRNWLPRNVGVSHWVKEPGEDEHPYC